MRDTEPQSVQDVPEDVTCPSGHSHEWLTIWGGNRADYVCHHEDCHKMFYDSGEWY